MNLIDQLIEENRLAKIRLQRLLKDLEFQRIKLERLKNDNPEIPDEHREC